MSEGHGEAPADVRAFLPRPGEPVDEYAERLRALHRDLTLVLQAVERGLAAADEQEAQLPPPVQVTAPEPHLQPVGSPPGRGGAYVEIVPAPTGADGRHEAPEERRRPADALLPPEALPARPSAREQLAGPPGEPVFVERREPPAPLPEPPPPPLSPPAWPQARVEAVVSDPASERPRSESAADDRPVAEGGSWPPLVVAATVLGWLVVVALLLALLLDG